MDRSGFQHWLEEHPEHIDGDPAALAAECEREVREHAREEAWRRAKERVERAHQRWAGRTGFHASEAFVAREVCHQLSRELRQEEPVVDPAEEERWPEPAIWGALDAAGQEQLRAWVHDLAHQEEHAIWLEVVRFVDQRGAELVREGRMSDDLRWENTHSYFETASRVTDILAEDCEAHLPRRR